MAVEYNGYALHVNRDPFFEAIVRKLAEPLDPAKFEACVADILRRDWPRLVPVVGGSDGGMDGAIASDEGPPLPLVTTTARAKDIASNLERNLKAYSERPNGARRAVLASSQLVGGTRRRRLEQIAGGLGFQLAQIYDRAAIAALIYRDSRWAKELLGLSGTASALSRVSGTSRPVIGQLAVGRDEEFGWLREGRGDKVLVGQPGSGKTFLLQLIANEDGGLFMASGDRNQLADSIRDQNPGAIFVDDAQADPGRVRLLTQLRAEIGANFSIVATTWPGGRQQVEEAMGSAPSGSRELPRLGRDQIVKVIAAAGVVGPNELVRELVNQAEGRPGLAVTLAHMCLVGCGEDVVTGAMLRRSIIGTLQDPSAAEFLATIALTGDEGVELGRVAEALELRLVDARRLSLSLAEGGVLFERLDKGLTVRPPRLRHALIKDVFFASVPLPLDRVVSVISPSSAALASGLLGALYVGADVPSDTLHRLLIEANSSSLWRDYAWWSGEAARWCLQNAPERLDDYIGPGLVQAPAEFLPVLLRTALEHPSDADHGPLKTIKEWIESAGPGTTAAVSRRNALRLAATTLISIPAGTSVALEALRLSLFPGFEDHETDPGRGHTLTLRFGLLPESQLREIAEQWPGIKAALVGRPDVRWAPMLSAAEDWAYPVRHARSGVPEDVDRFCRTMAATMLHDLCEISGNRPGVVRVARQIAQSAGLDFDAPRHRVFEGLFPYERFDQNAHEQQLRDVQILAEGIRGESSDAVLELVAYCEREARDAALTYPRLTPELCRLLSQESLDYAEWVAQARRLSLPDDCTGPFIAGLVRQRPKQWTSLICECLEDPRYSVRTASILLQTSDVPDDVLTRAVQKDWNRMWVCVAASQGSLSTRAVDLLLADGRDEIAGMTAVGLWKADSVGSDRAEAVAQALFRCPPEEYELGEILKTSADLARKYLIAQLTRPDRHLWSIPLAIKAALETVSDVDRVELIRLLDEERHGDEITQRLVSDSADAFRLLLSRSELKSLRFAPIRVEQPTEEWLRLIECALSSGCSRAEVLSQYSVMAHSWWGPESAMWTERATALRLLHAEASESARTIVDELVARCEARAERSARREKLDEVYGD